MRLFPKSGVPGWCSCAAILLAGALSPAAAETDLTPYAGVSYAYQSNPFYQWGGTSAQRTTSSDSLLRLLGGADLLFVKSRQSLSANLEVRRFEYETLTELERTERLLSGAYEWTPTLATTVGATYRYEHRLVPLDELATLRVPLMENENVLGASWAQRFAGLWRLESRFQVRDLASPRPGVPDLNLHETSLREALRRALGSLSFGLDAEYLSGSYHGAGSLQASDYRQVTVQLAAERSIADFSTFECALGYTTRDDQPGSSLSTLTGFARYARELSGKTSAEVFLRRAVNSYVTGANTEIQSAVGAKATWLPTLKLRAMASVELTRSEFKGSVGGSARHDDYETLTVQLHHAVLDSLWWGPYGRYAARSSNIPWLGFNAREIGIEFVLREPR